MNPNRQSYFPQIDRSIDPKLTVHLQRIYPALNDHDQAIELVKNQLNDVISGKTTIKTASTNASTSTTTGVTSFNSKTGAVVFFPSLAMVNDQSGQTAYTTQTEDSGKFVIFNDASPVAVDLNTAVTAQWFCVIQNWGVGLVTLTPDSPALINSVNALGATTLTVPQGYECFIFWDGVNFWSASSIGGRGTTGKIPLWTAPDVIGDSHLDDGLTTPGAITSSEPLSVSGDINTTANYKIAGLIVIPVAATGYHGNGVADIEVQMSDGTGALGHVAVYDANGGLTDGGPSTSTYPFVQKSSAYPLSATDYQVECTTGTFNITLPTAVGISGKVYSIKNTGTGVITVVTTSSQTIDGALTQTLNQWDNIQVMSNGSNWIIV